MKVNLIYNYFCSCLIITFAVALMFSRKSQRMNCHNHHYLHTECSNISKRKIGHVNLITNWHAGV